MIFTRKMNIKLVAMGTIFIFLLIVTNGILMKYGLQRGAEFTYQSYYKERKSELQEDIGLVKGIIQKLAQNRIIVQMLEEKRNFNDISQSEKNKIIFEGEKNRNDLKSLIFINTIDIINERGQYLFSKDDEEYDEDAKGDVSSFAALCTALSATIGTGNIVGVATAIATGGPGALLWMWIAAFFGMATKYAEGVLAIKYREVDENGQMSGGPMYYIEKGVGNKFLAKMFAVFGVGVALLGIGTFGQVNSIASAAKIVFNVPSWISAIIITVLVALITLGGIKRISKVAEKIVPTMAILYILG